MTREARPIVIRLTANQARLVRENAGGWCDAGSCEGGLTPDEIEALTSLQNQISKAEKRLSLNGRTPEDRGL